ncbi:uncharacterized protein RSE6_07529 [Rhynchosporium secalis]|uniref:Uncharacterized protein n=1 Tax=Rhynchosporium secalis TaxID=38038 RepID=A0A1E1MD60_RHYSE|nr:uncharacterized protein RSE6_07529 [Rhynchosporium secalis]
MNSSGGRASTSSRFMLFDLCILQLVLRRLASFMIYPHVKGVTTLRSIMQCISQISHSIFDPICHSHFERDTAVLLTSLEE